MIELFEGLSDLEKHDIEKNWGTTLGELKKLAVKHDEQVRIESIPEEERRDKEKDRMLEKVNMGQIMQSAIGTRRTVEYKGGEQMAIPQD